MAWTPISNAVIQYAKDAAGTSASGYYLKFYASGTSTPFSMASASDGSGLLAKCQINSLGYPINGSGDVFIPHVNQDYRIVLYPTSADADANTFSNAVFDVDGVVQQVVGVTESFVTKTELASSSGSSMVGFEHEGSGAVLRVMQDRLRHVVYSSDYTTIQEALDAGGDNSTVIIPPGTHTISSMLTLNYQQHLKGSGRMITTLEVSSDIVAVWAKFSFSAVSDMTITTDGVVVHTTDLVQIGQTGGGGGRVICDNLIISNAGRDNIRLQSGNLTVFRDITSTGAGSHGIHLTTDTVDNNACVFDGIIDVRANGLDGVHFGNAISSGDALSPSACTGNIIAQQNGRYGVNIGSHKNILTIYAESNTTEDIHFGSEARGNMITTVEATTYNASAARTNNNQVLFHNLDNLKVRGYLFPVRMNEGAIIGDSSFVGYIALSQTANQEYTFGADGTSSTQTLKLINTRSGQVLNIVIDGSITPESDGASTLGTSSLRYNRLYANKLNPGTGSADWSHGTGSPEGVVTASPGSLFTSSSTGLLYVKQTGTGNTGWVSK